MLSLPIALLVLVAGSYVDNCLDDDGRECCVYPSGSQEFNDCCARNGCCPRDCYSFRNVSCCFNKKLYPLGSDVHHLPYQCCLKLVCGGVLTKEPPFITPTIIPVSVPSPEDCTIPPLEHCVKDNGIAVTDGYEWQETPCKRCLCVNSVISCWMVRPVCSPAPEPHCIEMPGECCPTYDCTKPSVCVDSNHVEYQVGDEWIDPQDYCIRAYCTEYGIVKQPMGCIPLPPPPHQHCSLVTKTGQCCPTWECRGSRGCVDDSGVHHEVGDSWTDSTNPCLHHTCTSSGIQTEFPNCIPQQPRPNIDCLEETVDCCKSWRCSYCVDNNGRRRAVGEDWTDSNNPCSFHVCTEAGNIGDGIIDCPPRSLPPRPNCIWVHEGLCCGFWKCDPFVSSSGCPNPESVLHHCMDVQRNCSTRNDCTPDTQCCPVFGCDNRCLPEMKPGSCPPSSIPLPLCDFPVNKCKEDNDCPYDQKCCWDCGSRCKQAVHQPY
ncbi:hypothetical protein Pmani_034494 [Petrolisthes manimaculis]|uniref:Kielin/chordin-like protein n=1 Tax=Petrolisthes manimaculis TaxID=1843537 RepID=A0AAE1TPC5_9EUCA|nr:hypothetical protein Pmani_034494 [Petrolisthes manimaculis]